MDSRLNAPFWALRIAIGAMAFLAGLDKFFTLARLAEVRTSGVRPAAR